MSVSPEEFRILGTHPIWKSIAEAVGCAAVAGAYIVRVALLLDVYSRLKDAGHHDAARLVLAWCDTETKHQTGAIAELKAAADFVIKAANRG